MRTFNQKSPASTAHLLCLWEALVCAIHLRLQHGEGQAQHSQHRRDLPDLASQRAVRVPVIVEAIEGVVGCRVVVQVCALLRNQLHAKTLPEEVAHHCARVLQERGQVGCERYHHSSHNALAVTRAPNPTLPVVKERHSQ